jgi:dCTP deaminase
MILTGSEIFLRYQAGDIEINPFEGQHVEPNSYAFHLGEQLLQYNAPIVDPKAQHPMTEVVIPRCGYVLEPDRFYLGHTLERIGGLRFASELYANQSTAPAGIWVQSSAPLGHTGAVISWTLEICVAQRVRVYPGMRLGKICFWSNMGKIKAYSGRYSNSQTVIPSRLYQDQAT